MRVQEQANGIAYTHKGTTILFAYGVGPSLILGDITPVRFVDPHRYGEYDTPAQRAAFMRAFTSEQADD